MFVEILKIAGTIIGMFFAMAFMVGFFFVLYQVMKAGIGGETKEQK
jgi:hypothetical protein